MAIAQTNTRVMAEFVGGVALQSALGSAATPSRYLNMERMVIAGNFVDLEYRGTQGQLMKKKEPVRRVATDPEITLRTYVSRRLLATFMESCLGSQPYASLGLDSGAAFSLAGVGASAISALMVRSVTRDVNTTSQTMYGSMIVNTSAIIRLYKNAAKTSQVASAYLSAGSGATSLVSVGSNGFSGTITIAAGASTNSFTITVKYLNYQMASKMGKYMTIVAYDGTDKYQIKDCAIAELAMTSRDAEGAFLDLTLKGRQVILTQTAVTASITDWTFYAHNSDLHIYRATDYSTEVGATEVGININNNLLSYRANSSAPLAQIVRGRAVTGTLAGQLGDELNTFMRNAFKTPTEDITWDALQYKWEINGDSANYARFKLGNVHVTGPHERELVGDDDVGDVSYDFESYESDSVDALTVDLAV